MKYLLDTHTLLWSRLQPSKLSRVQRGIISQTDSQKFISTVTLWEISLKFGIGKLELDGHTPEEFYQSIQIIGFQLIAPTADVLTSYHRLRAIPDHKDPFDRLLVWQAINSDMVLLTADTRLGDYKPFGLRIA